MALHFIVILSLVQGITEFLPISSSGHLYLTGAFIGSTDQGLEMDVAVHVGSLAAVMLYFWRDMWTMIKGTGRLVVLKPNKESELVLKIILGTIPVVIAGYFLYDFISSYLRNIQVVAWSTIGFGILLFYADKIGLTIRKTEHVGFLSVFFIGMMQVLALVPGTSRSGITMTAARFMGMERTESARISMLLSVPTILAAGVLISYKLWQSGNASLGFDALIAAIISFIAALISIIVMMNWLKNSNYTVFVVYRILLGGALLFYSTFS